LFPGPPEELMGLFVLSVFILFVFMIITMRWKKAINVNSNSD
jgi:hypothetical protein